MHSVIKYRQSVINEYNIEYNIKRVCRFVDYHRFCNKSFALRTSFVRLYLMVASH